jgi:hypothetical protein
MPVACQLEAAYQATFCIKLKHGMRPSLQVTLVGKLVDKKPTQLNIANWIEDSTGKVEVLEW